MTPFPLILESIGDLDLEQIQFLFDRAHELKGRASSNTPSPSSPLNVNALGTVATLFQEHSTRTQLSFQLATMNVGARFVDLKAQWSSLQKGEDLEQTFLTLFHLGIDLCIYRTPHSKELSPFRARSPFAIINAGDGINEHPTQALLDFFTMRERNLHPSGKTILILGDSLHSRVCHSLLRLLPLFGMKIILCGPAELLPSREYLASLMGSTAAADAVGFVEGRDRDDAICQSDIIYLLRIQKERHQASSSTSTEKYNEYLQSFGVTYRQLKKLGKSNPVFHAGPANIGFELDLELINSPLYMGHAQVYHGTFLRMALVEKYLNQKQEYTSNHAGNGPHSPY